MPAYNLCLQLMSGLHSLFLFTRSDTVLVIFPMLTIGLVLAGQTDWKSFLVAFLWLELHLLAFDVRSFAFGIEEDRICKPYRPFPSGRVSAKDGQLLYNLNVAVSFYLSFRHNLTFVSLLYFCATTLYNEFGLSTSPLSPIRAIGYMCYAWGTTYIIGHHQPLDNTSVKAIIVSGLIFSFTGHAQDFRDRSGDALLGRRTIPLIFPQAVARWSLILAMSGFTFGLIKLRGPPLVVSAVFSLLCTITSVKFASNYSEEQDRKSFRWYEVSRYIV
ncbi:hypothetical protein K435DRAFT_819602 [Dendrothele bispora CBS 962.96]|uniref:UbiA prenyltransferase n=1 Tax=Dendrothele bispora (strain CBS 962.96) TaxID=1314807 RepID=A0A4S8M1Y4_DENBC|nr:hypothetical protein K435DRAFT_819602 [Dendrothele bispora CBS 962.96]